MSKRKFNKITIINWTCYVVTASTIIINAQKLLHALISTGMDVGTSVWGLVIRTAGRFLSALTIG